jgi:hypothetical protein
VISGEPGNLFLPNEPITRAEFAVIAAHFYDPDDTVEAAPFSDTQGHWAQPEIDLAYAKGIIQGYSDGTFRPDQTITRAEAMTIMNRLLNRNPHEEHLLDEMITWPDNMDTTAWYYEDVQEATNSHNYTRLSDSENGTEVWTGLLTVRDWSALEKEWSTAGSSQNTGDVSDDLDVLDTSITTLSSGSKSALIPADTLRQLSGQSDARLRVQFSDCQAEFDRLALEAIANQTDGDADVSIYLASVSGLTQAQREALASYQVARLVTADLDGGASTFGDGVVAVSVPFTPAWGVDTDEYSVVYVAEDGTLEYVDSYCQNGRIVFYTNHFSDYAIVRGYQLPQGRLVSPWITDGKWLLVAVPVGVLALTALLWGLHRKGGRHGRRQ